MEIFTRWPTMIVSYDVSHSPGEILVNVTSCLMPKFHCQESTPEHGRILVQSRDRSWSLWPIPINLNSVLLICVTSAGQHESFELFKTVIFPTRRIFFIPGYAPVPLSRIYSRMRTNVKTLKFVPILLWWRVKCIKSSFFLHLGMVKNTKIVRPLLSSM